MIIYRFVFDNAAQAKQLIDSLPNEPQNVQVHERGTLYDSVDTGQLDDDGMPVFESVAKDGYHVDVCSRHDLDIDLTHLVEPDTPRFEF